MIYCDAEKLSGLLTGLGRGISSYLTVSVLLLIERTLRYHNEHQVLWSAECVHQLIPESVVWLVTAVTDELRRQLSGCFLIALAGMLMKRLALETEKSG